MLLDVDAILGAIGFNDLTTDAAGRIYVGSLAYRVFAGDAPRPGHLHVIDLDGRARTIADGVMLLPDTRRRGGLAATARPRRPPLGRRRRGGERMIKSVVFFKRKPGMSVGDFQAYWLARHPDVVTKLPGIRRYVQSHTLPSIYARREPAYDGIAEIWTDDMAALRALVKAPQYQLVKADEAAFIDGATMGGFVAREHVVVDGSAAAVKSVELVRRRPDLTVEAFQHHWRDMHGPIASTIPVLRRYVQSHALPESYERRPPPYDGIATTWFDSTDAMRHSARTAEYAATRADEPNFVAPGAIPTMLTTEHVIVG